MHAHMVNAPIFITSMHMWIYTYICACTQVNSILQLSLSVMTISLSPSTAHCLLCPPCPSDRQEREDCLHCQWLSILCHEPGNAVIKSSNLIQPLCILCNQVANRHQTVPPYCVYLVPGYLLVALVWLICLKAEGLPLAFLSPTVWSY